MEALAQPALEPRLGFIPVRLQTWMPYQIQVHVKGPDILAAVLAGANATLEHLEQSA